MVLSGWSFTQSPLYPPPNLHSPFSLSLLCSFPLFPFSLPFSSVIPIQIPHPLLLYLLHLLPLFSAIRFPSSGFLFFRFGFLSFQIFLSFHSRFIFMGNIGSTGSNGRRRHGSRRSHPTPPPPAPPQPEISSNRYVFAAATPYPTQYPNHPNHPPPYYQYPGYFPPPPGPPPSMPMPLPAPYDHHHRGGHPQMDPAHWVGGRYPYGPPMPPQTPYVEHQKAVTIRNDVNLKKETLRVEPDEENPGQFLVSFTFDATIAGSITVFFFAKEGEDCNLNPVKEDIFQPVTVHFEQGLGQKFRQPSGTGIDFSKLEESEFLKVNDTDVYPLVVKAEASTDGQTGPDGTPVPDPMNSQITQAVFEKDKGEYQVRVLKQILWVNGQRYELQEIYGIGNSVEGDVDGNDPGKECVICLSEPRDTTVLPCRHMCMCSGCAKVLRFQTNRCPICRQPVDRLLEIRVSNGPEE